MLCPSSSLYFPKFPAVNGVITSGANLVTRKFLIEGQAKQEQTTLLGQAAHVALANHLALVQDADPVANKLHFTEQVGVQEHGLATRFQFQQHLANVAAANGIDTIGRLIKENDIGIVK